MAAFVQYVHDLQDNLHLQLTDNNFLSLRTLVRAGDTDTTLHSLSVTVVVQSSGAKTYLHNLQFLCPGSAA